MSDILLRIFGYAPSSAHKAAFGSWSGGPKEYKNLKIVDDDSYTHVALYYNGESPAMPNIKHIPKDNVIAFLHEPFELLNINWDYIRDNVGTCIVHDKTKVPQMECIKEWICYLPPGIPTGENYCHIKKDFPMSMVASSKGFLHGHRLRHIIIQRILASKMDIHIWGRGSKTLYKDSRVKGETETKHEMFAPYKYTIAIENAFYPWWVTEKFYDPVLVNTIPLYCGASEITKVFPNDNSYIELPYDLEKIMSIIEDVYNHSDRYSLPKLRQSLLTDTNYAHFLWRHFNNDRLV